VRPYNQVIIKPLITEKSAVMKEYLNKVVFEVTPDANKIEIKKAVEDAFGVTVEAVNVINMKGKIKRLGRHLGKRRDWKKAIVTLSEDSSIEFFEGV